MRLIYPFIVGALMVAGPMGAMAAATGPIAGQAAYGRRQVWTTPTVQGRVERVSPDGNSVTLVGGMTLTVPSHLATGLLKAGEEVTITYRTARDGQREMTAYWIDVGPDGSRRN
jgi:hypothetical protein